MVKRVSYKLFLLSAMNIAFPGKDMKIYGRLEYQFHFSLSFVQAISKKYLFLAPPFEYT